MSDLNPCKVQYKSTEHDSKTTNSTCLQGLEQQEFMVEKVPKFLKANLIKECKFSKHVSTASRVLKPHQIPSVKKACRMVIYMGKLDEFCIV